MCALLGARIKCVNRVLHPRSRLHPFDVAPHSDGAPLSPQLFSRLFLRVFKLQIKGLTWSRGSRPTKSWTGRALARCDSYFGVSSSPLASIESGCCGRAGLFRRVANLRFGVCPCLEDETECRITKNSFFMGTPQNRLPRASFYYLAFEPLYVLIDNFGVLDGALNNAAATISGK